MQLRIIKTPDKVSHLLTTIPQDAISCVNMQVFVLICEV